MANRRSLWRGGRRRDTKLGFEILSEVAEAGPQAPAVPQQPPATVRQPAPAPAPKTSQNTDAQTRQQEREKAVALKRSPRQFIYEWLVRRSSFGGTDEEIQTALQLDPGTARARRGELVRMKLIVDSGIKRATRSGRPARVWRAAVTNPPKVQN